MIIINEKRYSKTEFALSERYWKTLTKRIKKLLILFIKLVSHLCSLWMIENPFIEFKYLYI